MTEEQTSRSPLRRAAELSPLWLGVGYTVAVSVANVLFYTAARLGAPILDVVGLIIGAGAPLLLYIVITWYRDDDAFPAGVLLALTMLIGGSISTIVVAGLTERSITAMFAQLLVSPTRFVLTAVIAIPLATALVWTARFITRIVERATGIAPQPSASGGRPYRSVWERREAKRNKTNQPPAP